MFTIHTSKALGVTFKSFTKNQSHVTQSAIRLSTGYRINTAADDAAGLQIAMRLTSQTNGMKVAQRNISDAVSLLQTAGGTLDEVTSILFRMKDLATQSANSTNSDKDRAALSKEYHELGFSIYDSLITGSTFGGKPIFGERGSDSFTGNISTQNSYLSTDLGLNIQIGDAASESMAVSVRDDFRSTISQLYKTSFGFWNKSTTILGEGHEDMNNDGIPDVEQEYISTEDNARKTIDNINKTIDMIGGMNSKIGSKINRLSHTSNNLQNGLDNLSLGLGNVMDTDYAKDSSIQTKSKMLKDINISMLNKSNSMSSMFFGLIQGS